MPVFIALSPYHLKLSAVPLLFLPAEILARRDLPLFLRAPTHSPRYEPACRSPTRNARRSGAKSTAGHQTARPVGDIPGRAILTKPRPLPRATPRCRSLSATKLLHFAIPQENWIDSH